MHASIAELIEAEMAALERDLRWGLERGREGATLEMLTQLRRITPDPRENEQARAA